MVNNTGFISRLGATTQLVDGTDAIHTGIIKTLNVAMGQNRLISTAVITQGTTSNYTHYEIEKTDGGDNALTAIRDGMVVSVPNKKITTHNPAITANASGGKDWYGLIVIADGTESGETLNNLYFREGAVTGKANTSTATVAELKSGDIPIALVKYTAGSAIGATRDIQWLTGNVQTSRGFSAINGGSETFKINPTGTISYGSATITLPSSTGTLARTADVTSSIAAISTGNGGLIPSAGSAGEFLKHDGTFGTPSYIANTNTQNEYATSFVDSSNDIILRLTESGAGSGTQDIKFVAGSNVTLTHTDANNITIASTDTNTQLPLIDSDTMTGASATNVASAESVKAYVDSQVSGLVSSAPTALDTLNELAAALGDDANFATTTSTALGNRLRIDSASQNLTATQKSNAITNLGLGAAATLGTAAIADGGTGLATADQIHTFVTGLGYTTSSQISTEAVQDIVGAMFTSNTETRVGATYDDTSGKINVVVDDMTADTNKFLSGLSLSGTTITATVTGGSNQTLDIASVNTDTNTNIGTTDIISGLTALSSIDIANDSLIFRDNSDSGAVKKLSLTELMGAVTESLIPSLSTAKITSGTFATARIPTLAQSKITSLTSDLAAKVPTSRTIAGKALSNNLTLGINAAGKLEINDGGTAVVIQNASNADVIFDNSKITTATLGLDNVTNVSQATIQAATLTAAAASDVGLGNVNNTADTAKPVSTAQQTALDLKANLASPTFTGTVSGITKAMVGLTNVSDITTAAIRAGVTHSDVGTTASDVGLGNVTNESKTTMFDDPTFTGDITIPNGGSTQNLVTALNLNTAKNTYPSADATKVGHLTVNSALNLNTMSSNITTNATNIATNVTAIGLNTAKVSYTDASAVSTNTAKLTANATNVTAALVASTSIDNDDKTTILSNIGAGTSSLALGTTSSTALAGNTAVDNVSVANLLARADDLTTNQATAFRTSIGAGSSVDSNDYVDAASFSSGTLTIGRTGSLADLTVDISGVNTDTNKFLSGLSLSGSTITATVSGGTNQTLDISSVNTDTVYALTNDLAASEITAIQNIGATTITAAQWGYLGAASGSITNTDSNVSKVNLSTVLGSYTGDDTLNIGDSGNDTTINIKGNLNVLGTTTTLNKTEIDVQDALVFSYDTDSGDEKTTLRITEPTANRTVTIPDADFTIPTQDTTYSAATTSAAGLLTSAHFDILDDVTTIGEKIVATTNPNNNTNGLLKLTNTNGTLSTSLDTNTYLTSVVLGASNITGAANLDSLAAGDSFVIHDTSNSALREMTVAQLTTYLNSTSVLTNLAPIAQLTASEINAMTIDADTVSTFTVGKNVPSNAVFTDTNTTYTAGSGLSLSAGNAFTPDLAATDIPNLNADKITDGTFGTDRIADDAITEDKLADTLLAEIDANTLKTIRTQEEIEDFVGGMLDGTETFITVGYDDVNGNLDFVVPVKDEDAMTSNSANHLVTQQSIVSYVGTQISNLVDSSPDALNTLNELAAALGDDASFSTTMATSLGNRLRVDVNNQSLNSTQQTNALANLGATNVGIKAFHIADPSTGSNGLLRLGKDGSGVFSATLDTTIGTAGSVTSGLLANDAVTFTKMQNIGAGETGNIFLGRLAATEGVIGEVYAPMISVITAAHSTAARTALGASTFGAEVFTLADTGAIRFLRMDADNGVSALSASDFRTAIGASASGASNFGVGDITGATALTTGLADTDELILNDAGENSGSGALKRMDISVLKSHVLSGIEAGADVTDTANVTSAGALMDSELTAIAHVKALDQSVISGATPTFTTTNFTSGTDKNLITDAQLSSIGDIAANTAKQPTDDPAFTGKLKVTGTSSSDGLLVYDDINTDDYLRITSDTTSNVHRSYIANETGSTGTFGSMEIIGGDRVLIGSAGLGANKGTYFWQGYEGGIAPYLRLTTPTSSGTIGTSDAIIMPAVDGKEIIFQQYDGTEVARIKDNATFDIPDSKLSIAGTAVTVSATELNLLGGLTSISSAQITTEQVQDIVGAMFATNTETGISATYADGGVGAGKINLAVGTAPTATALETARTISGVSFDGSDNIILVTDNTDNTNFPVVFANESTGALHDDTGALRYNPSTGTLLVPNLNVAGTTTQIDTVTMEAANAIVFEGATSDDYETTLTITDPTADRTITLPNANAFLIGRDTTDILTNKTIAISQVTELSNLTASEGEQLENIGTATINATQWGYVGALTANKVIDWTSSSAGTIHSSNYTNTTYSVGDGGLTENDFTDALKSKLDNIAENANNYTHPTHDGDDIDIDTTLLSGATVISDLDLNITTDTLGHVTDANATIATRNLTLADLGFTGDADATDDLTAPEIRTLVGTGNGGVLPSAGTTGHFLKHDGTFGALPAKMAFTVRDSSDTDVLIPDGRFIKFNEGNGLDITFTDVSTGDTGTPFELTLKVADDGIGADQLNVSGNGSSGDALLSDGDGSFSWGTAGDATLAGTQTFSGAKTFTSDVNLDNAGLNINNQYSRINFKKDATNNATNNAAIFFYNSSDSIRGAINYMYSLDRLGLQAGGDYQVYLQDGKLYPATDNDVDLGTSSLKFKDSFFGLVDAENFKVNGGQGSDGQILTSTGSGVAWEDAAGGGASALNGLTDVISNITNFTDSILISPDNAAPPHGTLSSANDNLGIGKDALKTLTSGTKNVVIGNYAGDALTTNRELVLIGYNAGSSLTGNKHETVVIGSNALSESADSSSTVAIGQSAGQYAEGFNNVMVGNSAGKYWQNTGLNSQKNVFIGSSAGNRGTVNGEQTWVTAIGADAGNRTAIGSYSTIIGGGAGQWTRGESNTFIGQYAGQGNTNVTTSSNNNVAIGRMALYGHQMTSSGNNVAIGPSTLYNTTTGSLNIALGNSALNDVTSGNNNIGIGFGAGDLITTADKNITIGYDAGNNITTGSNNVVIGGADVPSATGNDQLVIASGDGSPTWITGASTGVVDFPNGLTNNGVAIESAFETITDVTIGSGTSGTTSGIYFGANNEAGIVAGEVSSVSTANDGYIELMNMDLDSFTGASGLQTIELTIQIEDETNGEVESFKALVQATEKTVLGTTVRAVNFTEWAILFDGSARIGTLAADYDSSDDTIRIRYQNKQGTTATLTATFYAITMQNNT